ncbi:hypothetical protein BT93_G1124 [Corymbia citriodora subsp. variegata]|nr:hypothetical protein BT93_G1124 [Corymbia citriodora subsp. variegata]
MVPLECLNSNTFQALFKMSEEEFGLSSDGPITMPCDASSLEYMISLVQSSIAKDIEKLCTILLHSLDTQLPLCIMNMRKEFLVCG